MALELLSHLSLIPLEGVALKQTTPPPFFFLLQFIFEESSSDLKLPWGCPVCAACGEFGGQGLPPRF